MNVCTFIHLLLLDFFLQVAAKIDEILKPIASVLPVDLTISILNPVIATGEFPTNLCAIKLLTELVINQSEHITDAHVDTVMPNIAKVIQDATFSRKNAFSSKSDQMNLHYLLLFVANG